MLGGDSEVCVGERPRGAKSHRPKDQIYALMEKYYIFCNSYVIISDTMSNASITVRLAPHDIKIIDKKIDEGMFTSRSDVIRYSIRHTLSEIDSNERNLDILAEIAKERKITKKDVRKALKKAHIEVYQEVYGDD